MSDFNFNFGFSSNMSNFNSTDSNYGFSNYNSSNYGTSMNYGTSNYGTSLNIDLSSGIKSSEINSSIYPSTFDSFKPDPKLVYEPEKYEQSIYDLPNGTYGKAPPDIWSAITGKDRGMEAARNLEPYTIEVTDKNIIVKNDNGHNQTYNKEDGTWGTYQW